jgi:hypothetical protein
MFWNIIIKTAIVHTFTYFLVGFSAFTIFKYTSTLDHPANNFRPAADPLVRAGVLFQPIRGILFGIVFYFLKDIMFLQTNGWLTIWMILVVVGIFSTFAPAASSIEGLIYLKSDGKNWGGLVEILTQSFLLSTVTYYWVNNSGDAFISWVCGGLFAAAILLSLLGLLAKPRLSK